MIQHIPAINRHYADHGWLKTHLLFSFGGYSDPSNMQHGQLRVFNDDSIDPGQGFNLHPHKEMEIVSLVIEGEVTHRDSMGNNTVIEPGEVQRMSAGTGIVHAELNKGMDILKLYQLWIIPEKSGQKPSYEQKNFTKAFHAKEGLHLLVAPAGRDGSVDIGQDCTISIGHLKANTSLTIPHTAGRFVLVYVKEGSIMAGTQKLEKGDQLRTSNEELITLSSDGSESTFFVVNSI